MTTQALNAQLGGDYPLTWDGFIGQEVAKRKLITAARSARMRGDRMEHTLLASGTPGIGKTSLAMLLAAELGGTLKVVSGAIKVNDARIALSELNDGDVLFIDEIHQVFSGSKVAGEWLLHLLQDGVLMGPHGAEAQPKITVTAATTHAGVLPATVLERFTITDLVPYTDEEAGRIAAALAARVLEDCRDYLVVLLRDFAGGAGARALQDRLQEPGGLSMTERLLQEKDLIALTKAGRVLTATGIRRAAALRNAT
jgi:Holliday junction resolvasome RuvABC ATP-dependent DNA helicase subunit